jgi:hypothetical protein
VTILFRKNSVIKGLRKREQTHQKCYAMRIFPNDFSGEGFLHFGVLFTWKDSPIAERILVLLVLDGKRAHYTRKFISLKNKNVLLCPAYSSSVPLIYVLGSSVNIATRLWVGRLRNWDSIPRRGKRFFVSPRHLGRLYSPPSLVSIWYPWLLLRAQRGRGVKLTAHFHLLWKEKCMDFCTYLCIYL